MKKDSFILTLTVNSHPVVLHFTGGPDAYQVTALNDKNISPFSVGRHGNQWRFTSNVPDDMRSYENKISEMMSGYAASEPLG